MEDEGDLVIRITAMPTDLNPYGGVFGGWLMCQLALGASSLVTRRTGLKAVVVGATDFAFPGVMVVGDELNELFVCCCNGAKLGVHLRAQLFGLLSY